MMRGRGGVGRGQGAGVVSVGGKGSLELRPSILSSFLPYCRFVLFGMLLRIEMGGFAVCAA